MSQITPHAIDELERLHKAIAFLESLPTDCLGIDKNDAHPYRDEMVASLSMVEAAIRDKDAALVKADELAQFVDHHSKCVVHEFRAYNPEKGFDYGKGWVPEPLHCTCGCDAALAAFTAMRGEVGA